jgi:lysyl endopeptidase
MKPRASLFSSVGVVALCAVTASAQIRQPGVPAADRFSLLAEIPSIELPTPDVDTLRVEDQARNDWPLRYGAPLPTAIDSDSFGVWEISEDGSYDVWRIALVSKGAYSLGLTFSRFDLDPGAMVFLYDADRKNVLGAYTEANEQPNGMFAIQPFPGDTVIVEYMTPAGPGLRAPTLEIGEVVHDYRDVLGVLHELAHDDAGDPIPTKGGCGTIPINCPEGANYQDIKRSVVRTLVGGSLCSGSILNNTAQNFIPYMLTANHCGNMTNGIFTFGYEFATCGGGGASGSKTLSGSVKLAGSSTYDSQLYRLNQNIPQSYAPYFAGWDRAGSTGSPAVSIGHSGGDPKVIAIDGNGAGSAGTDWQVTWSAGYITGGHSGGPLFNAAKRVIGPACCVNHFSCGTQTAWYGKLAGFWTAGSLAQWLDPLASGASNVNGADPMVNCGSSQLYGAGCAGTWGLVPSLDLTGCFKPNGTVDLSIKLGLGSGQALLFFGLSQAALPMGSGCFLNVTPLLPVVAGPLPLSPGFPGQGTLAIQTTMPPTVTPGTFTMQAFIPDVGAPAGFSNTNGVQVTIAP